MKSSRRIPIGLLLVLVALAVVEYRWFLWFLLEPLPNVVRAGGKGASRIVILIRAVPELIPGLGFKESHLGGALIELSRVGNFPQRLPVILAAALIAASAIATGSLILRGLRIKLDRWERPTIGFGLGTIGLGLATLIVGRLGLLHPWAIRIGLIVPIGFEAFARFRDRGLPRLDRPDGDQVPWNRWSIAGFGIVAGPFLLIMALGSMLPTIDFDAIEYHMQGPKEYYQAGRIAFLPHNVYTSMPFGVEMLHLLGMEVVDDWWLGALVGQLLIAAFAPLSALLIGLTARRLGSNRAAWVAGIVYLTTPWIYRLAVIPYVEGPLCYFHAALIWVVARPQDSGLGNPDGSPSADPRRVGLALPPESNRQGKPFPTGQSSALLAGLLAGGAMATKYPGLISAVIPFGIWAAWASWRSRDWRVLVGYGLGVAVVMGPWLAKNVVDTGNPVYPLGYRVFGSSEWDPARDAQWSAAHGPKPIAWEPLRDSVLEVAGRSDWQSPLYVALVPLALLRPGSRRACSWLLGFSAYLFATWWLLTHRLDRFWLPILPGLAILAGLGADWIRSKLWVVLLSAIVGFSVAINATYCSTALAGYNEWLAEFGYLRTEVPLMINPPLARLDAELPRGAKVLLVGQAAIFHLNRPAVYNTVFDDETIEAIAKGKTPAEVGEEFRRQGIRYVYVDWFEIERYRSPGNYGFTPFVTPDVFNRLVASGVLRGPIRMGLRQEVYEVRPAR